MQLFSQCLARMVGYRSGPGMWGLTRGDWPGQPSPNPSLVLAGPGQPGPQPLTSIGQPSPQSLTSIGQTPHFYWPTPHFYWPDPSLLLANPSLLLARPLVSINPYSLLIYTSVSTRRHGLPTEFWSPPPGGADSMHRRSDSEPGAMLGAYAGPGWRSSGHLAAMLAPSWLQLGHLGGLLGHLRAILAPTWPSWPDLGSLLGNLRLPSGL